jgi:N-acetylglucosaminyldiphosphoundecaprenol N-acetyl-beta-D-mannosaminyltransferase
MQSRVAGRHAAGLDLSATWKSSERAGLRRGPQLAALSAKKGYGIYLLGGRAGVAERACQKLREMYPGVNIVGHHAPPLADLERMDHGDTLERIRAAKPDILMVAFGNPKQEKWIRMHAKRLGVPVSIGIGGSMDMLIGDIRRAPVWMQRSGLEWLGRCLQEPGRLLPRYARNFSGLVLKLPVALMATFLQRPSRRPSAVRRTCDSGVVHLHLQGSLEARTASSLDRTVAGCIDGGQLLVVHMRQLQYASPEGLGVLLDARQRLLSTGLSLTLASVPTRMKVLFSAWCLGPLFDEFKLEREGFALSKKTSRATRFATLVGKENGIALKSES